MPISTKVFMCGSSQAVRIPRKYRLSTQEVFISQRGDQLILTPRHDDDSWEEFFKEPLCPEFDVSSSKIIDLGRTEDLFPEES